LSDESFDWEPAPPPRALSTIASLLWVIVIAILLAFCFFASSLCITFLLAGFLAILIDPIPTRLERWRVPRILSSALVMGVGILTVSCIVYASYGKASKLVDDVPIYVERTRDALKPLTLKMEKVQKSAGSLTPNPSPRKVPEVRISESPAWPSYLVRGVGSVWGAIIVGGVVPFLTFFMLVRKSHLYNWLTNTFGAGMNVPEFVARLSEMVRGFTLGNVFIGLIMTVVTVGVLFALKIQGAIIIGLISGFLKLIPFVGLLLASALPLMAATLQFDTAGPFIVILVTVVALHLISANLLIPKFIGSRVSVGPVAATMGMLFWGWLWGAIGLLLAVPLTAFVKLVADSNPSLRHISNLLAETPRSPAAWARAANQKPRAPSIPLTEKKATIAAD
jgi:predicted PurR-regulated permease PerM